MRRPIWRDRARAFSSACFLAEDGKAQTHEPLAHQNIRAPMACDSPERFAATADSPALFLTPGPSRNDAVVERASGGDASSPTGYDDAPFAFFPVTVWLAVRHWRRGRCRHTHRRGVASTQSATASFRQRLMPFGNSTPPSRRDRVKIAQHFNAGWSGS